MLETLADPLVQDLEARASAANLTIGDLCREAGIARSTFTRWKSGASAPQLRVYRKLIAVLDERAAKPTRRRVGEARQGAR